jgi:capsular polysaccharide transport system permease protein
LRYGLFGPVVYPYYSYTYPLAIIGPLLLIGLALCRHVRRTIVVE